MVVVTSFRSAAAESLNLPPRTSASRGIKRQLCVIPFSCDRNYAIMQRNYRSILRRYSTRSALPTDFLWFPRFFNPTEQCALLSVALRKLDAAEPRTARKRRRDFIASQQDRPRDTGDLNDFFLPDEFYHFEEVRPSQLRGPALPGASRVTMMASLSGSGKCASLLGTTRKILFSRRPLVA
jgi:hypothetical protein